MLSVRRGRASLNRRLRAHQGPLDPWTLWLIHRLRDFAPIEVMAEILSYLDGPQLMCLQKVDSYFRRLITDSKRLQLPITLYKAHCVAFPSDSTLRPGSAPITNSDVKYLLETHTDNWRALRFPKLFGFVNSAPPMGLLPPCSHDLNDGVLVRVQGTLLTVTQLASDARGINTTTSRSIQLPGPSSPCVLRVFPELDMIVLVWYAHDHQHLEDEDDEGDFPCWTGAIRFMTISSFQQHPLMPDQIVFQSYQPVVHTAAAEDRLAFSFGGRLIHDNGDALSGMNCQVYTLGQKRPQATFFIPWVNAVKPVFLTRSILLLPHQSPLPNPDQPFSEDNFSVPVELVAYELSDSPLIEPRPLCSFRLSEDVELFHSSELEIDASDIRLAPTTLCDLGYAPGYTTQARAGWNYAPPLFTKDDGARIVVIRLTQVLLGDGPAHTGLKEGYVKRVEVFTPVERFLSHIRPILASPRSSPFGPSLENCPSFGLLDWTKEGAQVDAEVNPCLHIPLPAVYGSRMVEWAPGEAGSDEDVGTDDRLIAWEYLRNDSASTPPPVDNGNGVLLDTRPIRTPDAWKEGPVSAVDTRDDMEHGAFDRYLQRPRGRYPAGARLPLDRLSVGVSTHPVLRMVRSMESNVFPMPSRSGNANSAGTVHQYLGGVNEIMLDLEHIVLVQACSCDGCQETEIRYTIMGV